MKNETISALSVLLTIESITSLAKKIKYLKEHNTEVIQKLIDTTIERLGMIMILYGSDFLFLLDSEFL